MAGYRFAWTLWAVLVLALVSRTSGADAGGWMADGFSQALVDQVAERVASFGAPILRLSGGLDRRVPADTLDRFDAFPDGGERGLLQRFGQLLRSSTAKTAAAAAGSPGSSSDFEEATSRLTEETRGLLAELGLWDATSQAVDARKLAVRVGQELSGLVGTNVWSNVSPRCLNDTLQFFRDANQSLPYTVQMLTSMGDRVSIEFLFTFVGHNIGSVDMCQSVADWNPTAPFETQYCDMAFTLFNVFFRRGACFPASCSTDDLEELFEPLPVLGPSMRFDCVAPYPWYGGAIATVCLLCFFLLLVIVGTTYHVLIPGVTTSSGTRETKEPANLEEKAVALVRETPLSHEKSAEVMELGKSELVELHNNGFVQDDAAEKPMTNGTSPPQYQDTVLKDVSTADQGSPPAKKQPGLLGTILVGFSCIQNGAKILNTEQPKGSLSVLNGIRVLSMWWVILGHSISFLVFTFYDNTRYALTEMYESFWFSAVVNATLSVDTFFFLSGLLVTYLTLRHLRKGNGSLNWGLFYLHRFVRITPAYMVCLAVHATLAVHFGTGPTKRPLNEDEAGYCREHWWTNLLYINNLYPFPGILDQQCISWSWYLANDMQFFIISPIIIYLLYKNSKLGMGLIMTLAFGSFGVTAYLASYYGTQVGLGSSYNNNSLVVYGSATVDVIYGKPYCRIPAYLVGMVFGYIFYKQNGRPIKINKVLNVFLWFLSTAVALAVVYGLYRRDGSTVPQYVAVLYTVFSRPAFVTAVGWVAFSCNAGYGGPVNALLSWGFWAPLSRITFGAYLVHPITMFAIYTSADSLYHFTWMQSASQFIVDMVIAYAAAFVLSIGVEGPVLGLEKALLGGIGSKAKKK